MKDLNLFRKDDVLNELVKVIREDKVIGDKNVKNSLLCITKERKAGSLVKSFCTW